MSAQQEIEILIQSRCVGMWITSPEETRVEREVIAAAARSKFGPVPASAAKGATSPVRFWSSTRGFTGFNASGAEVPLDSVGGKDKDECFTVLGACAAIQADTEQRALYIFRDLAPLVGGPGALPQDVRAVRDTIRALHASKADFARVIVAVNAVGDLPPALRNEFRVVDFPRPDRTTIRAIYDQFARDAAPLRAAPLTEARADAVVEAAAGLLTEEIADAFSRSIVTTRTLDPALIGAEKKRIVAASGVLEWIDPDPAGLDGVGGLESLKTWLTQRKLALRPEARKFGVPLPRGFGMVGVPGAGKSQIAKAIGTAWSVPTLRMDVGRLMQGLVGASESNLRSALQTAESVAPCVLWIDEIEKAFAGAGPGQSLDSGVSARLFGGFLTWLQDHKGLVFVVWTANAVQGIPAEFLRKGRFDELWFVDLPDETERRQIVAVHVGKKRTEEDTGRDVARFDVGALAKRAENCTGAEIEAACVSAIYAAFAEGCAVETRHVERALSETIPLAVTRKTDIDGLREWARSRCRPASARRGLGSVMDAARVGTGLIARDLSSDD